MRLPSYVDYSGSKTMLSKEAVSVFWSEELYDSVRKRRITVLPATQIHVDGELGHWVSIGGRDRLVVNVNESYLFWNEGQDRLCSLLSNMTLSASLDDTQNVPPALVNITMDCVDMALNHQGLGQGNWITAIYAARMATALAGVDFQFQCTDGRGSQAELLLPWFDQYKSAPSKMTSWPFGGSRPSQAQACNSEYPELRIDKMALQMQHDIRKMAVELVGSHDETRRHIDVPTSLAPLIPNVVLDDVVIHFRCGDVLGGAKRNDFGMIRFYEYKKWVPRDTKSIGILTQPFEKERNRATDARKADHCRKITETLVDYLKAFAAKARISIHNGVNETFPLAYARLAMANHSFTSLSSFGIFPVVATFGQGYFQKGNRGVNPFATYIPDYLPNIHEMNAEVRATSEMVGKPVEDLIGWFVDERNGLKEILVLPSKDLENNSTNVTDRDANDTLSIVGWSKEVHRMVLEHDPSVSSSTIVQIEGATGYVKDERLIIDVDESYLFWNEGSLKLCQLLKNATLSDRSLDGVQPVPLAMINATMDCVDHAKNKEGFGQGNWVTAVYASRMAAAVAGVDFKFQCSNGQQSKMELLLPWFDQYQAANPSNRSFWAYGGTRPNEKDACPPKYPSLRIDKIAFQIQDDLRRMSLTLLGPRNDDHMKYVGSGPAMPPLIEGVVLDDVAIHFRCGDVLGGAKRYDFGMIRFNEYKKWIPDATQSIGILTQPFEASRNRKIDSRKTDNCKKVVYALVDYLQAFAKDAKISIHNSVNETLPLAYARLTMANYSITSLSSFGIFPIIGTFGQGFFQAGNRGVNPFAKYLPDYLDNLHMMQADVLPTGRMREMNVDDMIAWFVNDSDVSG